MLALLLSGALITILELGLEHQEAILMERILNRELIQLIDTTDRQRLPLQRQFDTVQWYANALGQPVPPAIEYTGDLAPGIHSIENGAMEVDLGIVEQNGLRFTVVVFDQAFELNEEVVLRLSVAMFFLSLLIVGWFGGLMARRVVKPIEQLTRFVSDMPDTDPCKSLELPADLAASNEEIGILANRIFGYRQRLCEALLRERHFTGDASHELRTPLSVIRAATEAMLDQPTANPSSQRRLQRIARAAREMEDTLKALLILAGHGSAGDHQATPESTELANTIQQLLASELERRKISPESVIMHLEAEPTLAVGAEQVNLVVGNLIRNAFDHGFKDEAVGLLRVDLNHWRLRLRDSGAGFTTEVLDRLAGASQARVPSDRRPGRGFGLAIAQRVCAYHGWALRFSNPDEGGLEVIWRFSDKPD